MGTAVPVRSQSHVASVGARPDRPAPASLAWGAGLIALTPFRLWHAQFERLFWFADDRFLLDQISRMGFWPWTMEMFAENFAPLFKLLWGGAAFVFHGSYLAMLVLLWLTRGWPAQLNEFCNWRGSGLRQLFFDEGVARAGAKVPALEFMPVCRAKELIRAYNFH